MSGLFFFFNFLVAVSVTLEKAFISYPQESGGIEAEGLLIERNFMKIVTCIFKLEDGKKFQLTSFY